MAEAIARKGRHAWPKDGNCANCGTALAGHWCHHCGQRAADHHRSLGHLLAETIEGLTHTDGRLWHTLRLLALRPARLTNDYLRGRRASEIPPLRLFFATLLVVFASGSLLGHIQWGGALSADNIAEIKQGITHAQVGSSAAMSAWLRAHLTRAVDHPQAFLGAVNQWSERFAILLLPLSALNLRLVLFPLRRGVTLYDHLIFTMHSLSFAGCVWVIAIVVTRLAHMPLALLLFLLLPGHLFMHLRGVYRTSVIGTLFRMWLLLWCTGGVFLMLMLGLAAVSLGAMDG